MNNALADIDIAGVLEGIRDWPQLGFCPRVVAVSIDGQRIDITSWAGLVDWLKADAPQAIHIDEKDRAICLDLDPEAFT